MQSCEFNYRQLSLGINSSAVDDETSAMSTESVYNVKLIFLESRTLNYINDPAFTS